MCNGSWFESSLWYHKVLCCTVPYGNVAPEMYGTVRYGTGIIDPRNYFRGGGAVPATETGQKIRATYLATYCAVQMDTRII